MKPYFWFAAMLLIIALPVFSHLDEEPLRLWDESRLAANAFEMQHTNNWLVTSFGYRPDMWNTKPPAAIWVMAVFAKLFGPSELVFRLPSAIFGILTCCLIFWFCAKKLDNPRLAFLSCFVLITSRGFVDQHRIRTGDYDSLLTLATTSYCIFYFLFLQEKRRKHFIWFIASLILAALTKGVAAMLFLPALFIYTLAAKQLRSLLTDKKFYYGVFTFAVVIAGYYLLRERANPGYLKAVAENELGGRYVNTLEGHQSPFSFYLDCFQNEDLKWWLLLFPFGIMSAYVYGNSQIKKMTGYFSLLIAVYLLVISNAATKLEWYSMPVFPFIAVIVGIFLDQSFGILQKSTLNRYTKIAIAAFLIAMLWRPYDAILELVMYQDPQDWTADNLAMAKYMSEVLHNKRKVKGHIFTNDTREAQNSWCYYEIIRWDNNLQYKDFKELTTNDTVAVANLSIIDSITNRYDVVTLDNSSVKLFRINGIKQL